MRENSIQRPAAVSWLVAICLFSLALAEPRGRGRPLETKVFNPSGRCGECHAEIYATWRRSLHSMASSDPIFDAAYAQAYRETQGAARKICLPCHAPVAYLSGDLDLSDPVSREGVTCDFCHSTTQVHLEKGKFPYSVALDGIKRGPLGDGQSPVHKVARSDLFRQAELCAGCHEYANESGLLIFSTYSEWRVSPQAKEGKTCQHCHMPQAPGRVVVADLATSRQGINLHDISGAHSSEQVRKAAYLRIVGVRRTQPESALIEVEVANVGSGHYIPTGLPTRKLVLEVDLYAGDRKVETLEQVYQRVLLDAQGRPIDEDYRVVQDAASLLSDNRLRPGERRLERLVARVPRDGRLRAAARLRYVYEPMLLTSKRMSILMVSDETQGH